MSSAQPPPSPPRPDRRTPSAPFSPRSRRRPGRRRAASLTSSTSRPPPPAHSSRSSAGVTSSPSRRTSAPRTWRPPSPPTVTSAERSRSTPWCRCPELTDPRRQQQPPEVGDDPESLPETGLVTTGAHQQGHRPQGRGHRERTAIHLGHEDDVLTARAATAIIAARIASSYAVTASPWPRSAAPAPAGTSPQPAAPAGQLTRNTAINTVTAVAASNSRAPVREPWTHVSTRAPATWASASIKIEATPRAATEDRDLRGSR